MKRGSLAYFVQQLSTKEQHIFRPAADSTRRGSTLSDMQHATELPVLLVVASACSVKALFHRDKGYSPHLSRGNEMSYIHNSAQNCVLQARGFDAASQHLASLHSSELRLAAAARAAQASSPARHIPPSRTLSPPPSFPPSPSHSAARLCRWRQGCRLARAPSGSTTCPCQPCRTC